MISRIVLLLIAAYFCATAGYAILNADAFATDGYRITRYIAGPGVLALAAVLAALLLGRTGRALAATYSAAVLASLFLAEAYLTVQLVRGATGLFADASDTGPDPDRFAAALPPAFTLKGLNEEIGVDRPADALLGNPPGSEVFLCRNAGEPVIYSADRYGFRNDDAIYDSPVDIMLLGDSFAEGICLHDGTDVAARLADHGATLMNTGTRGAGPLFELAILQRFGPILAPRQTVMLVFGGNDAENLKASHDLDWLTPALDGAFVGTPPVPDQAHLDQAQSVLDRWWTQREAPLRELLGGHALVRNFFALQRISLSLGLFFPAETRLPQSYDAVVASAADTVRTWDGSILLVYLPPKDQFVGSLSFPGAYDTFPRRVEAAARAAGVGFLDLSPAFWSHSSPASLYAADAHLSEQGATFAAASIAEALDQGLELTQNTR